MNLNTQSVMKAAGIGAAVNAVIGILSGVALLVGIDAITIVTSLLACCGGLLIPVATGALYGYFTPGKEELGQAAAGGAVSGLTAGLVFGVFNTGVTAAVMLFQGADFETLMATTGGSLIGTCCGAIIFGSILGAIGGAVWTVVQGNK